jgi:hypothetical protein
MSKPYPSAELPQNVDVQSRLEQVEMSSTSVGFKPTAKSTNGKDASLQRPAALAVVTHRCRVYRLTSKALPPGEFIYTAVHDTKQHPFVGELPDGEPVWEVSSVSITEVEREMNLYREGEGGVHIIDWRDLGTF